VGTRICSTIGLKALTYFKPGDMPCKSMLRIKTRKASIPAVFWLSVYIIRHRLLVKATQSMAFNHLREIFDKSASGHETSSLC
jgi:hypothetical protein